MQRLPARHNLHRAAGHHHHHLHESKLMMVLTHIAYAVTYICARATVRACSIIILLDFIIIIPWYGYHNMRARVSLTLRLICGYLLRSLQPFLTCIYETLLNIFK